MIVSPRFPIILSAPSGTGKTSIARALVETRSDIGYSISATTRTPRAGEVDGQSYYFLNREQFEDRIKKGEFAEYAKVHGNLYGTLVSEVERITYGGQHVIMDIDVQGAEQFGAAFANSLKIFILPPSGEVLLSRLKGRGTEDSATILRRLSDARTELERIGEYQYVVVNDDLERAVQQVACIIDSEVHRQTRLANLSMAVTSISSALMNEIDQLSRDI